MSKRLVLGYVVNALIVEVSTWMVEDKSANPTEGIFPSIFKEK